jgi:hypothetical protein
MYDCVTLVPYICIAECIRKDYIALQRLYERAQLYHKQKVGSECREDEGSNKCNDQKNPNDAKNPKDPTNSKQLNNPKLSVPQSISEPCHR